MKASLIELVRYKRTGFGKLTSCNLSIYHILSAPFIRPVTHLIVATLLLPLCWILVENEVVTAGALLYRLRLLIKLAPVSLCVKYGGCCLSDCFMMFTDLTWWSLHDTKVMKSLDTASHKITTRLRLQRHLCDVVFLGTSKIQSWVMSLGRPYFQPLRRLCRPIKLSNWSIGSVQFSILQTVCQGILLVDPSHQSPIITLG